MMRAIHIPPPTSEAILFTGPLGFIVGLVVVVAVAKLSGVRWPRIAAYMVTMIPASLLIGRWIHISSFRGDAATLGTFWRIWEGDFSIFGFCIGPVLVGYLAAALGVSRVDIGRLVGATFVGLPLAQVFGRIGCLLRGCCYGAPTENGFGVVYSPSSIPGLRFGPQSLHPTQLYESVLCLALFIALMAYWRRRKHLTAVAFSYMVGYGTIRVFTQTLRADPWRDVGGIDLATIYAIGFVVTGACGLAWLTSNSADDTRTHTNT